MRLIYLSPNPWSSFSQRSHEIARYFHSYCKGEVLWINPYPVRFPNLNDLFTRFKKEHYSETKIPEWLTVVTPKSLPIEPMPLSGGINHLLWKNVILRVRRFADKSTILGIGKPSVLALSLLSEKIAATSFYDAMDDFPSFFKGISRQFVARREEQILNQVTTIITSSSILLEKFNKIGNDVRLILNACAVDRLPQPVISRTRKKNEKPVIGYIGTMGYWFDWHLVASLAKSFPEADFRLIGPVYSFPQISLPHNVSLESPMAHGAALKVMTGFDIGLIPFKIVQLTSSVDPIKYYEYRSMGLPVISSSFGEMVKRNESDGVFKVDKNTDLKAIIQIALSARKDLMSPFEFRENNAWESRFAKGNMFALKN